MGKRTSIETESAPSGKEIRTPATQTIKNFNVEFDAASETIDGANSDLKEAAIVAKKKHLHLKAFKDVKKLYDSLKKAKNESIAAERLAAYLANFDWLRKHFKLDQLANLQGRMLKTGEIGGDEAEDAPDDEHPEPDAENDDDAKDFRPNYLKQPDASVTSTNPVQELADKSGAKTSGVQPIDQVGRGQPKLN